MLQVGDSLIKFCKMFGWNLSKLPYGFEILVKNRFWKIIREYGHKPCQVCFNTRCNILVFWYIYIYGLWLYYLINWSYILWVFNTNICIYIFLIWCVTFRNIPYANSVINEYRYTQSTLRNTTKLSEQGSYDATRDGPLCIQGVTGKMIIE